MDKRISKNSISLAALICSVALGAAIGFSDSLNTVSVVSFQNTTVKTAAEAAMLALDICCPQMIQMLIIYLSGLTVFSYPVCMTLIGYRACMLSCAISSLSLKSPAKALVPVISYAVITLFASLLAYRSMTMNRSHESFKKNSMEILAHTYTFLTISGASVFMKMLPMFIFKK